MIFPARMYYGQGMATRSRSYVIERGKVIFDYSALYCDTPEKLLRSDLFLDVMERFIERLASRGHSLFAFIIETAPWLKRAEMAGYMVNLFRLLSNHSAEEVVCLDERHRAMLSEKDLLHEFVEELYNYWRRFERFLYMEAPMRSGQARSGMHDAQFIKLNEEFKHLVLYVYRRVIENLMGRNPRVYRQLPAGANMGMLLERIEWDCPDRYRALRDIPFIRISLTEPPLILYPVMNKRKGKFEEVGGLPEIGAMLEPSEWFCFPAKVGELTAFIYFHRDFISLGLSLVNLFELAEYDEIEGRRPDLLLLFGLRGGALPGDTVFFEDGEAGVFAGLIRHSEEVDYFGYFKKMTLTLHNIAMLKRGRLPLHGAMAHIKLKSGGEASVVIVGDSGAGKSETLEALRAISDDLICEMRIVFDDMGSLGLDAEGRVVGYGTEIGAFVRLDDLEPGYAYEEIDRSIFMNPDKSNARLVMPITRYHHVVRGYPLDMVLYANNYEQIDEAHPSVEFFSSAEEALSVFRSGARLAKGTTDEKGLVHTYFANPFGAPQRMDAHEERAAFYFSRMFGSGVRVGQIRTRLGIEGFGQTGPRTAAVELLRSIKLICRESEG